MGEHNQQNALAAIATAFAAGIDVVTSCAALVHFKNAKRRMEHRGEVNGICVYDDFAHHPTAIRLTLEGIQKRSKARAGYLLCWNHALIPCA